MHEADIEETPAGRVAQGEGWFILNLGEMAWRTVGFGTSCSFNAPTKDPDEPGIDVAAKHGASVARTTSDAREAYEDLPPVVAVRAPAPFDQSA